MKVLAGVPAVDIGVDVAAVLVARLTSANVQITASKFLASFGGSS